VGKGAHNLGFDGGVSSDLPLTGIIHCGEIIIHPRRTQGRDLLSFLLMDVGWERDGECGRAPLRVTTAFLPLAIC
jgi:hypothetical protein